MAKIDIESMDRRFKWLLLIASAVSLALLIVSALSENIFAEWRHYRLQYAELLGEKATDDRGRGIADLFETGIDQNVLPSSGTIDRCVTCHAGMDDPRMADEEQPFRTHPGEILLKHPPDVFGCTVCHQGQGLATETEAAHGSVPFWPHPMVEKQFLYSACSQCHDSHDLYATGGAIALAAADGSESARLIQQGKSLLEEKGCRGCHVLNGRGGTLGPDITTVGDKTAHEFDFSHFARDEPREVAYWLRKHFLEPAEISPGTLMPDLNLSREQADSLTAYVLSLKSPEQSGAMRPGPRLDRPQIAPPTGAQLYSQLCSSCHGPTGEASEVPGIRTPALNNRDSLAVAGDDYYRFIIAEGRSGTAMPAWGPQTGNLSQEQIDGIVQHIRGWEAEGADTRNISSRIGDARMGRAYYQGLCANCHGRSGQGGIGNSLNAPTFLGIASDDFLARTIIGGRPGTAMASWKHLPEQAVSDILAYIREWQPDPPSFAEVQASMGKYPLLENAEVGMALYEGNCASCHGLEGEGGIGPRLNSPDTLLAVDDEYLYRAIVEGRPGAAMPAWPQLSADKISALIDYIRLFQPARPLDLAEPPGHGDYALGEVHYNVSCAGCHGAEGQGGVGPQLSNPVFLSSVSDATLYHWIGHGRAGTAMKGFAVEEQGVTELHSNQIADVIAYLRHLGARGDRPILRTGVGNPFLGRQLFAGNCASCHGQDGQGASAPQLNNPAFLRSASDGFLAATIVLGREGTPMRSMIRGQPGIAQIAPDQVTDVIAYMRLWDVEGAWRAPRAVAEMSERAIHSGEMKFGQYCSGCHGPNGLGERDGEGFFAPALNNPEFLSAASDGFLLATIARGRSNTPMRPFGIGAGGIASLKAADINDIVSYIRTWHETGNPENGGSSQ